MCSRGPASECRLLGPCPGSTFNIACMYVYKYGMYGAELICFFLLSSYFWDACIMPKKHVSPQPGVADMIPGTLRSKSMVRSQLTDEGAPTCRNGVVTPGSRTIAGSPLLAVLIFLLFRSALIHCRPVPVSQMKHQKARGRCMMH
jgi:hypothetical protein